LAIAPGEAASMQRALANLRVVVQQRMTAALRVVAEQYAGDPRRFRDAAIIGVMQNLTRQYGGTAGAFAAEWYNAMRSNEGIRDRFIARAYIGIDDAAVAATVRRAVGEMFEDAPDLEQVFKAIVDRGGQYVQDAARETVVRNTNADPRARGWQRVAFGETCDFCLMLVGRGGVYTRDSARFKSHVDCDCGAVPSWDQAAAEVPSIAYVASSRPASESARKVMNARIQSWIETHQEELAELRASLS
jgi:hypothetical protein